MRQWKRQGEGPGGPTTALQARGGIGMAFIAIALASLIFLSTMLIVAALMMRGQWDDVAKRR